MKVFVNPGHMPKVDPGAIGVNGTKEAEIALTVGKKVAKYLTEAGLEVQLFQNDSLEQICDEANFWGADLFLSIHFNASENRMANGTETWYCYGSEDGEFFAKCLQEQLVEALPVGDRIYRDWETS